MKTKFKTPNNSYNITIEAETKDKAIERYIALFNKEPEIVK